MIYELNIDRFLTSKLNINQYMFLDLYMLELVDYAWSITGITPLDLSHLIKEGWIEGDHNDTKNIYITNSTLKFFKQNNKNVKEWIEEWRLLFPKGVKQGNIPVRGDKFGCLDKMEKFVKKYPEYTVGEIFQATKNYISQNQLKGYEYLAVAHNFIEKNKNSILASWCEQIKNNNDNSADSGDFSINV